MNIYCFNKLLLDPSFSQTSKEPFIEFHGSCSGNATEVSKYFDSNIGQSLSNGEKWSVSRMDKYNWLSSWN